MPSTAPANLPKAASSLLHTQHRRHWQIFAALAVLLGALSLHEGLDAYRTTTAYEEARLQSLARVIDINLQQQVRAIDRVLEDLAGEVAASRPAARATLNQRLTTLVQAMPGARHLIVADPQGRIIHASQRTLIGQTVNQRSFFTIPRQLADPDRLYVTPPIDTRLEKHRVLPLTRIIPGVDGGFNGIVEATIDPEFLSTLLISALYAPDAQAVLIHGEGQLIALEPRPAHDTGADLLSGDTVFAQHASTSRLTSVLTGRNGIGEETRLAALRTVSPQGLRFSAPLVVSVSRGVDAIYAPWYAKTILELGGMLLLITCAAGALRYYQRRQDDTETRFGHLIDHAPYGIMLIDADTTISRVNKAFTTLTGYTGDDLPTVARWRNLAYPDPVYRLQVTDTLTQQLAAADKADAAGGDFTSTFVVRTAEGDDRHIKFVETRIGRRRMVMLEDVTETERLASALRAREALLSKIFDTASVAIFLVDRRGIITHANSHMAEMFGATLDSLIGSEYVAHVHPAERDLSRQKMLALLASDIPTVDLERLYWRPDGSQFWGHLTGRRFQDAEGRETGLVGVISDIDVRKKAAQRHAGVVESAMDGFLIVASDGRIKECNQELVGLTGYSRDDLLQRTITDLAAACDAGGVDARLATVVLNGRDRFEMHWQRKDGEAIEVEITASYLDLGNELCAFVRDITLSKAHQRELDRIAHYDALTGLPNRMLLADRMAQAVAQTRRAGTLMALCYLDLDGFKPINDRYGHAEGDRVLIEIGRRLQGCLRGGDTVARIGGDEFVLLLLGLTRAEEDAALQRVMDAVAAPMTMADGTLARVSGSLGVAIYPRDDADVDLLLRHADQAMYRAKRAGKNCYRRFDPTIEGPAPAQLAD